MSNLTRRDVLKWSAAAVGSSALARVAFAADAPAAKKVLFFTKSSHYEHSVIARKGDGLAYAEKILVDLGKKNGMDVTCSKDGSLFTPAGLAPFDLIVFFTTGDLTTAGTDKQTPMPASGKDALIAAIAGGKGFAGIHSASDTFHGHGTEIDPYIAMIGGEFVTHGQQQESTLHVVDPKFPGVPAADIHRTEEWYALTHFAPDLHAILYQETKGMKGAMYQRPPYPSTWARLHEKGRVFYTSMGHREDVWTDETFTTLLMGGLGWAVGNGTADMPPNVPK